MDNTLINYDRAAARWAQANQLEQIHSVESLKKCYREKGNYSSDWLSVQEWLYTEGLNFADLTDGAVDILNSLQSYGFRVVIISHKSRFSAKSSLDLHSPVIDWLARALAEVDFSIESSTFLEEDRKKKISRIRKERLAYFTDDLLDVFQEPDFPQEVRGFWLAGSSVEIAPVNVVTIRGLREILKYV